MSPLAPQPPVFKNLGVRPLINACGIYTDLGGSVLSPRVWQAMENINHSFVRMVDLLERSGEMVASLLGADAARILPGASAAITLGTAACIAGGDGETWERLPDTSGLKNEVIIQKAQRYKYDRMVRIAGGRLVEAGSAEGTTWSELEQALGPKTAMVLFPAHLERRSGTISLEGLSSIAHAHGIPVFADAAYLNDPPSLMSSFLPRGADLVCFSAKYFWGPNASGFVCGRRDLIKAVAGIDFTGYESGKYLTFGRPWKMDRHSIVATVVALQEWLALDHAARWASYRDKVAAMRNLLADLPGVRTEPKYFTMDERLVDDAVNCMTVQCPGGAARVEQVSADLLAGDPSIATVVLEDRLVVAVDTVLADQHLAIAKRLRTILGQ
ncbi:MAG: aminotransferase class V-fold PLP-dependent enzyme [Terriglobales bacterium]|jgi:L-seryl-tRNA(Ser) seleniumtransferase